MKEILPNQTDVLNICYATDDNYLMPVGVSIISLLENNRDFREVNLYILDNGLSSTSRSTLTQLVGQFPFAKIDFADVRSHIDRIAQSEAISWVNNSFSTYARIFISEFVPLTVSRILYLDCDIIINGNLSQLWKTEMDNHALAGVIEAGHTKLRDLNGLPKGYNYHNAGVLLFNLENWRSQDLQNKILTHMQNVQARYPYADQDLINVNCRDYFSLLDPTYNCTPPYLIWTRLLLSRIYQFNSHQFYSSLQLQEAKTSPKIIHFAGELLGRPWEANNIHPLTPIFDRYLRSPFSPWLKYQKNNRLLSKTIICQRWLYSHCPRWFYGLVTAIASPLNLKILKKKFC